MIRYVLDTGIAGLYIDGRADVVGRVDTELARGNRVGICHPVLAELVYGYELSHSRDRNHQRLTLALAVLVVWPVTQAACYEYGRVAADLKRRGRPMQQNDVMIAAVALALGTCVVVTADSDFRAVPGLAVEDWRTPPA